MALTGKMKTRGVDLPNAYIRVSQLTVDNVSKTASASLTMHSSPKHGPLPLDTQKDFHNVPVENENPVQSIYNYMKTLDDYSHLSDC